RSYIAMPVWRAIVSIASNWVFITALMMFFGLASRYIAAFDGETLLTWFWLAPTTQVAAHLALRVVAPAIIRIQGDEQRAIIAGMNENGVELAKAVTDNPLLAMRVIGFFDDRRD